MTPAEAWSCETLRRNEDLRSWTESGSLRPKFVTAFYSCSVTDEPDAMLREFSRCNAESAKSTRQNHAFRCTRQPLLRVGFVPAFDNASTRQ